MMVNGDQLMANSGQWLNGIDVGEPLRCISWLLS